MAGDPKVLYAINEKGRKQQLPGCPLPHSPLLDNSTPKGSQRREQKLEGEVASGSEVRPGESGVQAVESILWNQSQPRIGGGGESGEQVSFSLIKNLL